MVFIPVSADGGLYISVDRWGDPPAHRGGDDGSGRPVPGRVLARLLTHAHTDHTGGLSGAWARDGPGTPIYCSPATAAFLGHASKWPALAERGAFVTVTPGDCLAVVDSTGAGADENGPPLATVEVLDGNHCPGSLMFLIRSPASGTVLHTGDCRVEAAALPGLLAAARAKAGGCAEGAGAGGAPCQHQPPPPPPQARPFRLVYQDATYAAHPGLAFPPRAAVAGALVRAALAGPGGKVEGCGSGAPARPARRRGGRAAALPPPPHPPPRWAEVAVLVDKIGKEELCVALGAALGVPVRAGRARIGAATAAGLPAGAFQEDEDAERLGGPLCLLAARGGGAADGASTTVLRVLRRGDLGRFVRACGAADGRGEEGGGGEGGGDGARPPPPTRPILLILSTSLHLLRPDWWGRHLSRAAFTPADASPADAAAGLAWCRLAGAPGLAVLEAPYSLHGSFAEAAAMVGGLDPAGAVVTGLDKRVRGPIVEAAAGGRGEGAGMGALVAFADAVSAAQGVPPGEGPLVAVEGMEGTAVPWARSAAWGA